MERPKCMSDTWYAKGSHSPFGKMVLYAHYLEGRIETLQKQPKPTSFFEYLDTLERARHTGDILEISYIDVHGSKTVRDIRVLDVHRTLNKEWIAKAYCFLRGAERSFRVWSIQSIGPSKVQAPDIKKELADLQRQHDAITRKLQELGRFIR